MFEKEALYYGYCQTLGISVSEMNQSASNWLEGAEFGYNKAFVEADKNLKAVVADFNKAKEYAKTIIQDLLNNSDEYARQRAMDFLRKE